MRIFSWKDKLCCLVAPSNRSPLAHSPLWHAYRWPGNVRELENVLSRALVFSEGAEIQAEDLSLPMSLERSDDESFRTEKARVIRAFERDYLQKMSTATRATSHTPRRLQRRIGERSGNSFASMACRWTENASQSAKRILGQQDDGKGQSGMDGVVLDWSCFAALGLAVGSKGRAPARSGGGDMGV